MLSPRCHHFIPLDMTDFQLKNIPYFDGSPASEPSDAVSSILHLLSLKVDTHAKGLSVFPFVADDSLSFLKMASLIYDYERHEKAFKNSPPFNSKVLGIVKASAPIFGDMPECTFFHAQTFLPKDIDQNYDSMN